MVCKVLPPFTKGSALGEWMEILHNTPRSNPHGAALVLLPGHVPIIWQTPGAARPWAEVTPTAVLCPLTSKAHLKGEHSSVLLPSELTPCSARRRSGC